MDITHRIIKHFQSHHSFFEKETLFSEHAEINKEFFLHTHDFYEILLFLEGDAEYIAEQNVYPLEPYDIVLARKNELHRIRLKSAAYYRRIAIELLPSFFVENNCLLYEP